MENRVLILASVASMIDQFNMPNIKLLKEMGYEVHVACNFIEGNTISDQQIRNLKNKLAELEVKLYQINFKRNAFRLLENVKAYVQVYNLARDYNYKFIHCHSPIGGVIGRLIGKKTNTKVVYTAHGFHFYQSAPLKNWIIYYPIEKWLSRYTDILITINKEDYKRAKSKLNAKRVEYIPGIGINLEKYNSVEINRSLKRSQLGLPEDAFVVLSVGELNKNKNHEVIIRAIAKINNQSIHYVVCGMGQLDGYLHCLIKKIGIEGQVHLLGFRNDIPDICKSSDIFAFPSLREGLGMAALEAMACGLPIVTSNIHGILDYSINEETGFNCDPSDVDSFSNCIEKIYLDEELKNKFSKKVTEVVQCFSLGKTLKSMFKIYNDLS